MALSPTEEADLRSLSNDLAKGEQGLWQPRCIARAFARLEESAFTLTMQGWIDLDAIQSPILNFEAPDQGALEQIQGALVAFDHPEIDVCHMTPEEASDVVTRMIDAVRKAFSTVLNMVDPESSGGGSVAEGFGDWMPMLACLITQCGMSRKDALETPVCQAYVVIATMRRNQGWSIAGVPYSLRSDGGLAQPQQEEVA